MADYARCGENEGYDLDKNVETVQFEEDGHEMQMEINDGGAATAEFASKSSDNSESEESDDNDNDWENNSQDDMDTGEITEVSESESEAENHEISERDQMTPPQQKTARSMKAKARAKKERHSVEDRLDTLTDTLQVMKNFMMKKGMFDELAPGPSTAKETATKRNGNALTLISSNSETTIYKNVLDKANQNTTEVVVDPEISFKQVNETDPKLHDTVNDVKDISSDEHIDTSDELMDIEGDAELNKRFIADCASEARRRSAEKRPYPVDNEEPQTELSEARQQAKKVIREAEASRATALNNKGMFSAEFNKAQSATDFGENYIVIGSHIDNSTKERIWKGEYIDFSKLLPKSVSHADDEWMELVNRGGQSFFVPISDRESGNISNFGKWEQAFRIFMNVYTQRFPEKAGDLIQYNHIIFISLG